MMETIAYLIWTVCIVLMIRNQLVYRYQGKRLEWASRECELAIMRRDPDYLASYRAMLDYDRMMLDLTKWRYVDFYPDRCEAEKASA